MGVIRIYPANQLHEWYRDVPGNTYGVQRFSYSGTGVFILDEFNGATLDPYEVKRAVDAMQDVVPLGAIGDYEVLLLDRQMCATDNPPIGRYDGIQLQAGIILSGKIGQSVLNLISHEVTHKLAEVLITRTEEDEFFALIGEKRGDPFHAWWSERPQERLAEVLSYALWNQEMAAGMPVITDVVKERVRLWALAQFSGHPKATVIVDGEPDIVLTLGSRTMMVRGEPVEMDVAPFAKDNRTWLPLRWVAEALGKRVEWSEDKPNEVRIYE